MLRQRMAGGRRPRVEQIVDHRAQRAGNCPASLPDGEGERRADDQLQPSWTAQQQARHRRDRPHLGQHAQHPQRATGDGAPFGGDEEALTAVLILLARHRYLERAEIDAHDLHIA